MSKRSKAVQEREEGPVEPESTPPPDVVVSQEVTAPKESPEVQEVPPKPEAVPEPKAESESNLVEFIDPVTGQKGRYDKRNPSVVWWP